MTNRYDRMAEMPWRDKQFRRAAMTNLKVQELLDLYADMERRGKSLSDHQKRVRCSLQQRFEK
jgi:hypothetical protein